MVRAPHSNRAITNADDGAQKRQSERIEDAFRRAVRALGKRPAAAPRSDEQRMTLDEFSQAVRGVAASVPQERELRAFVEAVRSAVVSQAPDGYCIVHAPESAGGRRAIPLQERKDVAALSKGYYDRYVQQRTLANEAQPSIPAEFGIAGVGRELFAMGGNRQIPSRLEPASRAATKKELAILAKDSARLLGAVENLHAPAIAALNYRESALRLLATQLRILIAAASDAVIPPLPPNAGKGKKPNAQALQVAYRTAERFSLLVGQPTLSHAIRSKKAGDQAYSAFLALLTEVFKILAIKTASKGGPAHYARLAIRQLEGVNSTKIDT